MEDALGSPFYGIGLFFLLRFGSSLLELFKDFSLTDLQRDDWRMILCS